MSKGHEDQATGRTKEVGLIGSKAEWRSLPREMSRIIKQDKISIVEETRLLISKDAQLPMPPIRVEPWGWVGPEGETVIFGAVKLFAFKECSQWGVLMPASTLLVVDDQDLLRRILCHEFAHCFWRIGRIIQAEANGKSEIKDAIYNANLKEQYDEIERIDKDHLVDPKNWFGGWDVSHFLQYEGASDAPELDEPTDRFFREWASAGLPLKTPSLEFEYKGVLAIPDEVVDRWSKIGHEMNGTDLPQPR
jgi:hypothetical protein